MNRPADALDALPRPDRHALRVLLIRATAAAGRPDDGHDLDALVAAAPIEALPAAAALHRVSGSVLRGLDGIDGVPDGVRNELARRRSQASLHHLIIVGALSQAGRAFDEAGISWVAMKGPIVAGSFYPDVGDRTYGDLDLLVARRDYALAMRILEDAGYAHDIHNWALAEQMLAGQVGLTSPTAHIDLHWQLHYSEEDRRPFALPPDEMVERARRVVVSGVRAATLDPVDTLITLAFHAARSDGHRLMWYKDVERAVAVDDPDLDELVRRCRAYRCGPPVGLFLGRARAVLGADIPEEIIRATAPATLRAVDRVTTTLVPPVQLHERDTVTRMFTRSVKSSLARSVLAMPERGARFLRRALVRTPANESDSPDEKASYLEAVSASVRGMNRVRRSWRTIRLAISLVSSAGRGELIMIVAASIVTSAAIAGQLLVGRTLLDLLADTDGANAGDLAPYLLLLGVLLLVAALSQAVAGELRMPLGEKVYRRTMDEILDVATEVDLEAYERAEFHDRLRRATMAAGGQSGAVVFGLVTIVSTLVVTIGVVAVLFTVAPILIPVALLGYVPIALVNVRNNRARYQLELDLTELVRERSYFEYVMTERNEAKEIRSFDVAPTLRRWHAELWDVRMAGLRALVRKRLVLTSLGSLVLTAVLIATLSIVLILAGRGSITIGDAAVAIVGLQQLSGRVQSAGVAFGSVHEGVTFLRDFETFRATLPVIREQRPTGVPPAPPTVITVQDLGYRYPDAPGDALRNVGFELRRGQVLAIVGANGSGKSTLSKLLCGLITPTTGSIEWDGVDLVGCDPTLVRAQIAPVFQDFARFMLTIRQSIALGDTDRLDDDTAIRRAATLAGVDELIASHPEGIDVRLGKLFLAGTDISIGQWQRLAIARALFRDAPVVIMDEPSASLDPRAEANLFDLLQSMAADRIVIFVSHRFATVRSADVVMVLEQGDVVEMGSHDELMAAGGLYQDLFELQAERYGLTT